MSKNISCLKSNQFKGNGGLGKLEGYTKYDAIRLVEKNNGLFIKLTDSTISRSYLQHGSILQHRNGISCLSHWSLIVDFNGQHQQQIWKEQSLDSHHQLLNTISALVLALIVIREVLFFHQIIK